MNMKSVNIQIICFIITISTGGCFVYGIGDEIMESRMFHEGNRTHLQCIIRNSNAEYNWCRAISPEGKKFMVTIGSIHGQSTILTNMTRYAMFLGDYKRSDRLCSLEIEDIRACEYGFWRFEVGITEDDYTGCFLHLPDVSQVATPLINRGPFEILLKTGDTLNVKCNVPWPISYCYIIDPYGQQVTQTDNSGKNARLFKMGVCQAKITSFSERDSGRWICGVSSNDGSYDKTFITNVKVKTEELLETGFIIYFSNGTTDLLCRDPKRRPFKYCRFVTPEGKRFSLKPDKSPSCKYSYFGAGLENGECGIRISRENDLEKGTWICAATTETSFEEKSATLVVHRNSYSNK